VYCEWPFLLLWWTYNNITFSEFSYVSGVYCSNCFFLRPCAEKSFRKAELVRARRLTMELDWFTSQGYKIHEARASGFLYGNHLMGLCHKNILAFICHLCNIYFAQSVGNHIFIQKVCVRKCSQVHSLCSFNRISKISCHGFLLLCAVFQALSYKFISNTRWHGCCSI